MLGGQFITKYRIAPDHDSAGNLYSITDHLSGETTMYRYDLSGKLVHSYVYDSETMRNKNGTRLIYDGQSRLCNAYYNYDYTASNVSVADSISYRYNYNDTLGVVSSVYISDENMYGTLNLTYDRFDRLTQKIVNITVGDTDGFYNRIAYNYVTVDGNASPLVHNYISTVGNGSASGYAYTYDDNGNIIQVKLNGVLQYKYHYDHLNQLIREDNRAKNATYVYTYDNAGNITSKKTYAFTVTSSLGTLQKTDTYTYGNSWGDLLIHFNGAPITYDAIGNPTAIDLDTLTWQGRELRKYTNEYYEISYTYNADGIRTSKELYEFGIGYTTRHEYILSGSQILGEIVYFSTDGINFNEEYRMIYLYDETGAPIGLKYRTPSYAAEEFDYYFFEKSLQGGIIAIYNETGSKIGTYTYDAWGNCSVNPTSGYNFILYNNPLRYRGYYYDTEIGLYYLQSRYYNPEVVGLESDRRRGRIKGVIQGRKQGVEGGSPALRTETTMFSSGPFKSHLRNQHCEPI